MANLDEISSILKRLNKKEVTVKDIIAMAQVLGIMINSRLHQELKTLEKHDEIKIDRKKRPWTIKICNQGRKKS